MLAQIKLTLTEAIQISALIPCGFLAVYLLSAAKSKKQAIIPSLYFISLAAGLIYRLLPALAIVTRDNPNLAFILLLADSMNAALSFLLILQLTFGSVPPPLFWSILAVPLTATTPFIYAFVVNSLACTADIDVCFPSEYALHLNMALASALIFMLLTVIFARRSVEIEGDLTLRKHKYWLIICLIIYNVILIGIELGYVAELIDIPRYVFVRTMVKIAFIYLIMTSIFRVFSDQFELQPPNLTIGKSPLTEYEKSVGERAEKVLATEKIYREPGFNRANFAKKLGVREHVLSRIINAYFNKSFSELANSYRIGEAKQLLADPELSITAISYDVGFSSITSFNRVFKDLTGLSPSDFRAMPRQNLQGE